MTSIIAYLILALGVWAHPTNTIIPENVGWIRVEWGTPVNGGADAYPGSYGICHIRLNRGLWESANDELRLFIMTHEIGHCLGLWEPATMHLGNGIMGCGYIADPFETCQFAAYDQFAIDALHPSPIVRRGFIPMVAR